MFGGDLKIGRLAGIPISIHPLWLVIVALITWSLGSTYYPDQVSGIAPLAAYGLGLGERAASVREHPPARARARGRRAPLRG